MNDKDLMAITGLSERAIKGYERIYPLMFIHILAEEALACTNGKLKKATIDIPNMGTIVYNTKSKTYSFKPTKMFDRHVRMAIKKGTSPLITTVTDTLIERINKQYKSLL